MRIYIAAPWVRKADAITASEQFKAAGHTVTSRWFDHDGNPSDSSGLSISNEEARRQAAEDIFDILGSEALVVLNLQVSEGKAVETGIALIAGLPVISVGRRSHVFHSLCIEVETLAQALEALDTLEAKP